MSQRDSTFDIVADGLHLHECPRWHDEHLWFSDMRGHTVYRIDDGRVEVVHRFPAGRNPPAWAGCQINELIVTSDGAAFVSQLGFDLDAPQPNPEPTVVIRVDPDGTLRTAADDLMVPNGIAVDDTESMVVVAESGASRLTRFTLRDGVLSDRTNEALPATAAVPFCAPDGVCLDQQGGRWVADSINKRVFRVHNGVITDEHLLDQYVLACVLGDSDRRSLYVCVTHAWHKSETREVPTGRIVRLRVAIPGVECP
jgi:sugar lactone lactonase YvrE